MSLTKIRSNNYIETFLTRNLKAFLNSNSHLDNFVAFDNSEFVIIKNNNDYYHFRDNKLKKINKLRTSVEFNNKIFLKDIDSFDQNNKLICNKIRKTVLYLIDSDINKTLIGIGGEFYIYFSFLKYKNYIGISNHQTIIDDANINCAFHVNNYSNKLVDYNKFEINNNNSSNIIINLVTVLDTVIKEIAKIDFDKLVIISCKPLKPILSKLFKLQYIEHFDNYNGFVSVSLWKKR